MFPKHSWLLPYPQGRGRGGEGALRDLLGLMRGEEVPG